MSYDATANLFYGVVYCNNEANVRDNWEELYRLIEQSGYDYHDFGCVPIKTDNVICISLKNISADMSDKLPTEVNFDSNIPNKTEIEKFKMFLKEKLKMKDPQPKWFLSTMYG